jgi:hypothetical protein
MEAEVSKIDSNLTQTLISLPAQINGLINSAFNPISENLQ